MKYSDTPDDPTEPIFPSPPTHPHEIELMLRSQTRVSSRFRSAESTDDVCQVGGMGAEDKSGGTSGVQVVVSKREWIPSPDDNEKGFWKQEANMRSTLNFKCTPTFSYPIMSLDVSRPDWTNLFRGLMQILGFSTSCISKLVSQGLGTARESIFPSS